MLVLQAVNQQLLGCTQCMLFSAAVYALDVPWRQQEQQAVRNSALVKGPALEGMQGIPAGFCGDC